MQVPEEYAQGNPRELKDESPVCGVKPKAVVLIAVGAPGPDGVVSLVIGASISTWASFVATALVSAASFMNPINRVVVPPEKCAVLVLLC